MKRSTQQFALCLENAGNEASLILGKVYRILPDARAAKDDLVRIVDESGDEYLSTRRSLPSSSFHKPCGRKFSLFKKPANTSANGARCDREARRLMPDV